MSVDSVDDLHNAEDRIGLLESIIEQLLEYPGGSDKVRVETAARAALADRYERPTCEDPCIDEFCGSPAHYDQEFNETTGEWEDT